MYFIKILSGSRNFGIKNMLFHFLLNKKILPINTLYFKTVCNLIHDVSSNESCPSSIALFIQDKFTIITQDIAHQRIFTLNIQDLRKQIHHSYKTWKKVWNNISTDVRELRRTNFNKRIEKALLTILSLRTIMLMCLY